MADRVCVRSHLRGDYEIQRVVELKQLEKQTVYRPIEEKKYQPLLKWNKSYPPLKLIPGKKSENKAV